MLKSSFRPILAVLVFGIAVPIGLHRLSRATGVAWLIAAAVALGLLYGAIKADSAWSGDGLIVNLRLMAVCAVILAAYVGISVAAVEAIARRL